MLLDPIAAPPPSLVVLDFTSLVLCNFKSMRPTAHIVLSFSSCLARFPSGDSRWTTTEVVLFKTNSPSTTLHRLYPVFPYMQYDSLLKVHVICDILRKIHVICDIFHTLDVICKIFHKLLVTGQYMVHVLRWHITWSTCIMLLISQGTYKWDKIPKVSHVKPANLNKVDGVRDISHELYVIHATWHSLHVELDLWNKVQVICDVLHEQGTCDMWHIIQDTCNKSHIT